MSQTNVFDPDRAVSIARKALLIEAAALTDLAPRQGAAFAAAVKAMLACSGRVAVMGMGKSGHVGRKIVATLAGPVTTARTEVDVIVTEFGAAELRGQSLAERTRRLVAIAHPDFREELDRAAHTIRSRGF